MSNCHAHTHFLFAVHFCWPGADGGQSWHLLGHITNQKPSCIFKVNNLKGMIYMPFDNVGLIFIF